MHEALAILGLAVASGLWVVVQRWARRLDPADPGPTRSCGGCALPPAAPDGGPAAGPGHATATAAHACEHGGSCALVPGREAQR